ncbi:MAG: hypothetical protein JO024_07195 [Candidatus Eremiobacteraeota bacterium]|nr:hypothetical protein [Candidatus Eremiobacteraeota bacterium]
MSHLPSEVLRRYVDDPDVLLTYEKEHLLRCARCRTALNISRENARFSAAALAQNDDVDVAEARRMLTARIAAVNTSPRSLIAPKHQFGLRSILDRGSARWMLTAAALAILVLLVTETPLRIYAQNFLTIFQPHEFQAVGLTASDISKLRALPDLEAFGTMRGTRHPHFSEFTDVQKAAGAAGMVIAQPAYLPAAVPSQRSYHVSRAVSASFTFNVAKARAFAQRKRVSLPPMTAQLDGATLTASVGPVVVQVDGSQRAMNVRRARAHRAFEVNDHDLRSLAANTIVITQARSPKVISSRATVGTIESYLLSIPGVPADLAAQIRAIHDPGQTVPVPFRIDKETAQKVTVQGAPALLVGDNTGVGSGVMWQKNGTVYGVAGPFAASEILKVANSIKM